MPDTATRPAMNGRARLGPPPLDDAESARLLQETIRTGKPPDAKLSVRLGLDWVEGINTVHGVGEEGISPWLKAVAARDPARAVELRDAIKSARTTGTGTKTIADPECPRPFQLDVIGAREFAAADYRMDYHVKQILMKRQPAVIAAPGKSMKTTLAAELVVSAVTGTPFLGKFEVPKAAGCLLISGESGGFVLRETIDRICRAKGIDDWPEAMEGRFFIGFKLPRLNIAEQVAVLGDEIRRTGVGIVIIDPLYLCMIGANGSGRSIEASNLFETGPLFQEVADICLEAGATPILVHHFTKAGQPIGEIPELGKMAFAGITEFARQWILINRRERYVGGTGHHPLWIVAGGSAGHGGEWAVDIEEGTGDAIEGRSWEVSVRHASEALDVDLTRVVIAKTAAAIQAQSVKDQVTAKTIETNARMALDWLRVNGPATKSAWRDKLGWGTSRMTDALNFLIETEAIVPGLVQVGKGKGTDTVDGYAVAPEPGQTRRLEGLV